MEAQRIPNAWLLSSAGGVGAGHLAGAVAALLLCRAPREGACGSCKDCELARAGTHPDWHHLLPEGAGRAIKIEQVRALQVELATTSQQGGRRVVIIEAAEQLNPSSANALLKSLEEPPAGTAFVLLSDAATRLPATVRSRCRGVQLGSPPMAQALAWLAEQGITDAAEVLDVCGGRPLAALAYAGASSDIQEAVMAALRDLRGGAAPHRAAQHFARRPLAQVCDVWLQLLWRGASRGGGPLAQMAPPICLELAVQLTEQKRLALAGHNLNTELALLPWLTELRQVMSISGA